MTVMPFVIKKVVPSSAKVTEENATKASESNAKRNVTETVNESEDSDIIILPSIAKAGDKPKDLPETISVANLTSNGERKREREREVYEDDLIWL